MDFSTSRRIARLGALAIACAWPGAAGAIGLVQAYEAALKNDPQYRAAWYEHEGGKEYANIGRAPLLPSVAASYSAGKNRARIEEEALPGQSDVSHPEYRSRTGSVQLRQPLFNMEAMARYRQGLAQTGAAGAQFAQRRHELVLRVAGAYADALYAAEEVVLATAQRDAYGEQRKVNDRLFERGEGTRTDMLETQARLDLAEADLLDAIDRERAARAQLGAIVGMEVTVLDQLAPGMAAPALPADGFNAWQRRALAGNPALLAQQHAVNAAREDIARSRAGHAPRLDLVASYSANESDTLNTLNQHSRVRSIGLQLNVPLYSGGQVSAVSRQAVAAYEKARAELQAASDRMSIELRKEYDALHSGQARIGALAKAVASNELLVTATAQSIKGGVRINLDLLTARQQLHTARRDLARARFNTLLAQLRLRAAAGSLGEADVREMAASFR